MAIMSMRYLREPRGKRKQWVYQRTIPPELQAYDRGKSGQPRKQIEIGLGRSKAEAIANYQAVHEQQEQKLDTYRRYQLSGTAPSYRIERLQSFCRKWHLEDRTDPQFGLNWDIMWEHEFAPFIDEERLRELETKAQDDLFVQIDYTDALNIPNWKKELYEDLKLLRDPEDLTSMKDVFAFYKKHKPSNRTRSAQRREDNELARLKNDLLTAVGNIGAMTFSRDHAQKLKQFLLDRKTSNGTNLTISTIEKYFARYRAIYHYWLKYNELHLKKVNPFSSPELPKTKKMGRDEKRLPLTNQILIDCNREYLSRNPKNQTMLLWFLIQLTGCRVSEIVKLLTEEVHLDSSPPYLDIKERENDEGLERSLKTAVSVRKVPLTPLAAEFAACAVSASTSRYLFPKWENSHESSPSAALGKVLHKHRQDKRYTTHSLRHNQRDRLEDADARGRLRDAIMGWENKAGMAARYGKTKLEDMYNVMCMANEELEQEIRRTMQEQGFSFSRNDEKNPSNT